MVDKNEEAMNEAREVMKGLAEMVESMGKQQAQNHELERAKLFPVQLAMTAEALKQQGMPQETVNMCLAARCGLPMQKIDPKSPMFVWVEDKPECGVGDVQ